MAKKRIDIKKPQYLIDKEAKKTVGKKVSGARMPFFLRLLLVSSYLLSCVAIWFAYQRFGVTF